MERPRVSIAMPVYNGANYMREAIDSALAQTYPNTEIVLVNDGSTDGGETDRIARSYGDRVRYISQPNGGVAAALNAGIEAMSGDIFCWLSHDDMHLPEKTGRQVEHWISMGRPEDVVLYSNYRMIKADGSHMAEGVLDHDTLTQKPLYALLRGSLHGCAVFVPRILFDKTGLFDTRLPTTQDYDLWFRMRKHATFVHMPEIFVLSRWHDEQGSKKIEHKVESNSFWRGVLDQIDEREAIALEGTPYRFYREMQIFLRNNKIMDAADHAARLADAALADFLSPPGRDLVLELLGY